MTCPHQSRAADRGQYTCAVGKHGGKPWPGQCAACLNPELSTGQMMANLGTSIAKFARSGFTTTDPDTLARRIDTCKACDLWHAAGMAGTGRCRKCGCSTQAKLRMASEKCPLGKW